MDSFVDYMWYLLLSPFKKVKKEMNQWYILCKVIGKRFDEYLSILFNAREETMVALCSEEMLPVHAAERSMTRYAGETMDNFRKRIAKYEEVKRYGGFKEGIILAAKALGYINPEFALVREMLNDDERWAEFFLILNMSVDEIHPVAYHILQKDIRKVKQSGSKDNYMFHYMLDIKNVSAQAVCKYHTTQYQYRLDGSWLLDGSVELDTNTRYEEVVSDMSTTIKTQIYTQKEAEARITGNISPVKYIAIGKGGEIEGKEKQHLKEDKQLFAEVFRKEVDVITKIDDTTYQFDLILADDELVGETINEMALIDADGDVMLFSTFPGKIKETAEDKYSIIIS